MDANLKRSNLLMKTTSQLASLVAGLSLGLLAGCATGPTVRVDRDPSVDLSRYSTFAFFEPLGTDREGYQSILSERLKTATRARLESMGYRYAPDSPDLRINFGARLDEKINVTTMPAMGPPIGWGYYGYRSGFYSGWYGYQETYVDQYKQGTLNVDVVDDRNKKLVWEGVAVGRVTEKTPEKLDATVNQTIDEVFSKFPTRVAQ